MPADFIRALRFTLRNEGSAYVNDPHDLGGPSRHGITIATLSRYMGHEATPDDVKALTADSVAPIYRKLYWDAAGCGRIGQDGIATMVFDAAVLCGPSTSIRMLNDVCRQKPVGHVLRHELANRLGVGMSKQQRRYVETAFCLRYQEHLIWCARAASQRKWLAGWLRRVQRCWDLLTLQAREVRQLSLITLPPMGRALPRRRR